MASSFKDGFFEVKVKVFWQQMACTWVHRSQPPWPCLSHCWQNIKRVGDGDRFLNLSLEWANQPRLIHHCVFSVKRNNLFIFWNRVRWKLLQISHVSQKMKASALFSHIRSPLCLWFCNKKFPFTHTEATHGTLPQTEQMETGRLTGPVFVSVTTSESRLWNGS